jgi:hypothetical protein
MHRSDPTATLLTTDDTTVEPLPWEDGRSRLSDGRYYLLTTVHPSGRPHVRPVLAVWVAGRLYTTSSAAARKGRNLQSDPHCSVAVLAEDMHIVLEGLASAVTDETMLERVAEAYRRKYDWPVSVVDGGFNAPYAAPTAGPAPYRPYEIAPTVVFGFVTGSALSGRHTRWRF